MGPLEWSLLIGASSIPVIGVIRFIMNWLSRKKRSEMKLEQEKIHELFKEVENRVINSDPDTLVSLGNALIDKSRADKIKHKKN